jgi:hypothetical protein
VSENTTDFPGGQSGRDTHAGHAAGDQISRVHTSDDPHGRVGAAPLLPDGHTCRETRPSPAAEELIHGPFLADPLLNLLASAVDDLEQMRMANKNRARLLTKPADEPDKDGHCRGLGLPEDSDEAKWMLALVESMEATEKDAVKALERQMSRHPLGPWVKSMKGVGPKQGARLLASVRDPYWNDVHDRPRTVSELWSYCGYRPIDLPGADQTVSGTQPPSVGAGNPPRISQRFTKGVKANWSPTARMRAWNIADSCVKQLRAPCAKVEGDDNAVHVDGCTCSPYRVLYDQARVKYADAVHDSVCRNRSKINPNGCGTVAHPEWGALGSPLRPGHLRARAYRIVAKQILKDLWLESRRLHGVVDEN